MRNLKPSQNRQRIIDAAQRAEDAFWFSVREDFPECTTGDMDPFPAAMFTKVAQQVVMTWVEGNEPAEDR